MQAINHLFLKSLYSDNHFGYTINDIIDWVYEHRSKTFVRIRRSRFCNLDKWKYCNESGSYSHVTGKFFSVIGLNINTNWGVVSSWQQPIINQPEIGYLGFITKEFGNVLHFLVQAKIEPGNINIVQLSPTVQATKSNYNQVHNGKKTEYIEYFQKASRSDILVDQLQSEQGARFLKKRNRNIIVKIEEEIEIKPNFLWLTLGQLKQLMLFDNLVNMDTRTVLSGIPYGQVVDIDSLADIIGNYKVSKDYSSELVRSLLVSGYESNSVDDIISTITEKKANIELSVNEIPLYDTQDWIFDDIEYYHRERKYFRVLPIAVEIEGREVRKWCQPMVQPVNAGIIAFIAKMINSNLHLAVQLKLECGNHDIIELAPTVQTLTGGLTQNALINVPFLEYVLNADNKQVIVDTMQSEEGGRFYQEQNRNLIILADENFDEDLPDRYIWMTLKQMSLFLKFNNYLNIQARSLLALLPLN